MKAKFAAFFFRSVMLKQKNGSMEWQGDEWL